MTERYDLRNIRIVNAVLESDTTYLEDSLKGEYIQDNVVRLMQKIGYPGIVVVGAVSFHPDHDGRKHDNESDETIERFGRDDFASSLGYGHIRLAVVWNLFLHFYKIVVVASPCGHQHRTHSADIVLYLEWYLKRER